MRRCIFTKRKEKNETDAKIEDLENAACEESMATDERLSDIENAICELSEALLAE